MQIQLLSITAPGARLTAARDLFVWLPGSGKLDQLIVTEGEEREKKTGGKKYPPACCVPVQIVLGEWLLNADRVCSNCLETEFIILKGLGHLDVGEFLDNTNHTKNKKHPQSVTKNREQLTAEMRSF